MCQSITQSKALKHLSKALSDGDVPEGHERTGVQGVLRARGAQLRPSGAQWVTITEFACRISRVGACQPNDRTIGTWAYIALLDFERTCANTACLGHS